MSSLALQLSVADASSAISNAKASPQSTVIDSAQKTTGATSSTTVINCSH